MQWLPALIALLLAWPVTVLTVNALSAAGLNRVNYRGIQVPTAAGLAIVVAALLALLISLLLEELLDDRIGRLDDLGQLLVYALGVALLGLLDDLSVEASHGFRGHFRPLLSGRVSSGVLKAVGSLALALYIFAGEGLDFGHYLTAVLLLALTTNIFNFLDLRPGRAIKFFLLLFGVIWLFRQKTVVVREAALFAAPLLVFLPFDLKEKAMLGDTGANLAGAVAGFLLVLSLPFSGQLIALALVVALTIYGEFRSLGALIEKTPLLSTLDSLGRKSS